MDANKDLFGIIATVMMLCSRTGYFASIFQGKTRPHAFSWLIWGVISSIGFAAQVAKGAGAGAWARGFGAATCFILVGLSLWRGEKNITRSDWITLTVALLAIPLWVATNTPVWSVILVCCIDCIGYIPTIRKAMKKPFEEMAVSYFFSGVGALLSLLAIANYNLSTYLYPLVLTISNIGMGVFLLVRREMVSRALAAAAVK